MKRKKNPLIIALISEKGGGKGTTAKYFEEKYAAKTLRFSFFIEEMLASINAPANDRDIIIRFITKLRELLGKDVLAKILVNQIPKNKLIIIDGVRFPEEYLYLSKHLKNFHSIALKADPKTRYIRTKSRGEKKNESRFTYSQFMEEHKASSEKFIQKTIRMADIIIDNNGEKQKLFCALDGAIKKFS